MKRKGRVGECSGEFLRTCDGRNTFVNNLCEKYALRGIHEQIGPENVPFVTSAHDDMLNKFGTDLNNTSINERKIAAATELSVAFLIAHPGKVAKLVHHLYYDKGKP